MTDVTRIINAIQRGEKGGTDELLPLVYEELRRLAAQKLSRERPGQTLQATALVHEAYLKLIGEEGEGWDHRGHFFSAAAEAMRRILVDNARRKKSLKRGGDCNRVDLLEIDLPVRGPSDAIIALDESLQVLTDQRPLVAQVVKLYYFAGLTLEQVAAVQGVSRLTAGKRLTYGRAWLHRELSKEEDDA